MFTSPPALEGVPLEEALERWFNELEFKGLGGTGPTEEIEVVEALGRVSAQSVMARRPSPHYYAAAVDGLAVKSTTTFGAAPENPVRIQLGKEGNFVDTGSPLPAGTDTVVPLSEVHFVNVEEVELHQPSAPWRNVSPTGEDMEAAEIIVPNHRRIRPPDMGAMLRGGVNRIKVRVRPRVGLIPVGSNLVPPGVEPQVGQRVESITTILGGLCRQLGAEPQVFGIVPERLEDLAAALHSGAIGGLDLLVIVSGRSHGTAVPAAWLASQGALLLYGANIKPGQSVTLGVVGTVPVIGIPGNSVSSYITFDLFARPLIARRLGFRDTGDVRVPAVLGQSIVSPHGTDEFLRVNLADVDRRRIAIPISRGADIVTSLVRANGILHVPAEVEAMSEGTTVQVQLMEPSASSEGNILLMGTYDPVFDLLRNALARRHPEVSLQSANLGSGGGLDGLTRGYCHVAAIHLFDDATGSYNVPFVQAAMPDVPLVLVNLFRRDLGFIVSRGNPKNIQTFDDLSQPGVTFVNRQHGSGTRVLIDHHLRRAGIDTNGVKGYQTETYTHMSLAATVASGAADVGIGIATVARALDLDFVPVIAEQLDLVIPRRHLKTYPLQCLLNVLRSAEFKADIDSLRHYDTEATGRIVYENAVASSASS